MVAEDSVGKRI